MSGDPAAATPSSVNFSIHSKTELLIQVGTGANNMRKVNVATCSSQALPKLLQSFLTVFPETMQFSAPMKHQMKILRALNDIGISNDNESNSRLRDHLLSTMEIWIVEARSNFKFGNLVIDGDDAEGDSKIAAKLTWKLPNMDHLRLKGQYLTLVEEKAAAESACAINDEKLAEIRAKLDDYDNCKDDVETCHATAYAALKELLTGKA